MYIDLSKNKVRICLLSLGADCQQLVGRSFNFISVAHIFNEGATTVIHIFDIHVEI